MAMLADACSAVLQPERMAGATSSPKRSLPSTRAMPSTRATRVPTTRLAGKSAGLVREAMRLADGGDDYGSRYSDRERRQRILHLALARTRRALDQRRSGEQHAGRADTALSSAMMMEGLLQPRQSAIGKAFDGLNRAALDLPHGRKAGAHGLAVEQHRAGATIAGIAADLGTSEPQILPQHL